MDKPYDLFPGALTVSEASKIISTTVSELFSELTIEGEVAGFRPASSGHWYFALKDSGASIDSAVFRNAQYCMEVPRNGDLVIARGSLSYYAKTGKLTFVIRQMRKKGEGDLLLAIEKRKDYYKSLGWFDEDRKKPIPDEIKTIGVVTSPTGAAIRDVLNVTGRRAPSLDILIFPCPVQGQGAAERIASRIRQANLFMSADVLIVTRGGGSVEDLAPFSEPEVVEAIHNSDIPVVTAIGHEIDWPIADFVADRRAPTPSAAAEIVTETAFRRKERLETCVFKLKAILSSRIAEKERRLAPCMNALRGFEQRVKGLKAPDTTQLERFLRMRVASASVSLGYLSEQIISAMREKTEDAERELAGTGKENRALIESRTERVREKLSKLAGEHVSLMDKKLLGLSGKLTMLQRETEALSPLSVLARGYSVARNSSGAIIRSPGDALPGELIDIRLASGIIKSRVEESYEL